MYGVMCRVTEMSETEAHHRHTDNIRGYRVIFSHTHETRYEMAQIVQFNLVYV